MKRSGDEMVWIKFILLGLALAMGVADAIECILGSVDLNRHLPFLLPAVLGAFALIVHRLDRQWSGNPAGEREQESGRIPKDF